MHLEEKTMVAWTLLAVSILIHAWAWWMLDKYTLQIRKDQREKDRLRAMLFSRTEEVAKLTKQLHFDRPYIADVNEHRAAARLPR